MSQRPLGKTSILLNPIGLGCMALTDIYGVADLQKNKETLRCAFELGVNHFDTADVYGDGSNEKLLGEEFAGLQGRVFIATKFGLVRDPKTGAFSGVNNEKGYAKKACITSLKRLNRETIDLFYLHRYADTRPLEDLVDEMSALVDEGKVRFLGLSGVTAEQLRKACQVAPISAVQVEYSLWSREPERELLPACEELGVSLIAYSPLGRGFLTGKLTREQLTSSDYRSTLPRFSEENFEANQVLTTLWNEAAQTRGCTAAQLALAWLLAQSPNVHVIPGTKQVRYLEENLKAQDIQLTEQDKTELNQLLQSVHIQGQRYPEALMKLFKFKE